MKASDELSEDQARQMLFDLEQAYNAFNRSLHWFTETQNKTNELYCMNVQLHCTSNVYEFNTKVRLGGKNKRGDIISNEHLHYQTYTIF